MRFLAFCVLLVTLVPAQAKAKRDGAYNEVFVSSPCSCAEGRFCTGPRGGKYCMDGKQKRYI